MPIISNVVNRSPQRRRLPVVVVRIGHERSVFQRWYRAGYRQLPGIVQRRLPAPKPEIMGLVMISTKLAELEKTRLPPGDDDIVPVAREALCQIDPQAAGQVKFRSR